MNKISRSSEPGNSLFLAPHELVEIIAGNVIDIYENCYDINFGKKNLFKDDDKNILEKDYNSFIINRGLSYFVDTVLYANEMNLRHELNNRMQNDYLLNSIRKIRYHFFKNCPLYFYSKNGLEELFESCGFDQFTISDSDREYYVKIDLHQ
mgnify:CR=1 FL=1